MKKQVIWVIIGIIVIWLITSIISSFYYPNHLTDTKGGWHMWPMQFWMGGMWIFPVIMLIVMLFFLNSIFGRRDFRMPWQDSHKHQESNKGSETALEILKKRYAKGEINKEEFERMKSDLLS